MDWRARIDDALLAFWTGRDEQVARQRASGRIDAGTRGAVTGGGHLDEIARLLADVAVAAGADPTQTAYSGGPSARRTVLPGYYRPTKSWDLVVWESDTPIVVVELKSQVGSFGNNANNRVEESLGNPVDLRGAADARLIRGRPWTGYAYVIEDCPASRRASRERTDVRVDAAFRDWTYVSRVGILCARMAEMGDYDATWAVATERPPAFGWSEPEPTSAGFIGFAMSMTEAIQQRL